MKISMGLKFCVYYILFLLSASAKGQQTVLPFQGVLSDQLGHVISPPSPAILMFRLYDQPIGGTVLWEEQQLNVVVLSEYFSVLLGSRTHWMRNS